MRSMSLWLNTLTVAGSTATVLHLIFFTALSWGALQPLLGGVLQSLSSAAASHFTLVAVLRVLQFGGAAFAGYHLARLVRRERDRIHRRIDRHRLDNLNTHVQTYRLVGEATQTLQQGITAHGLDLRRLYIENALQVIFLVGLAVGADKASVLSTIASRRDNVEREVIDDDAGKAAVLEVITQYEAIVEEYYPDNH